MALNKAISFQSDSVFGREQADVDYAIADDYVSRKHFQIAFMGAEAYLTDLNSRHGTFLNGTRITKSSRLQNGDSIRVGKTTLTFRLEMPTKSTRNRPALASYDQPAIVSIDAESDPTSYARLKQDSSLQDHPTDVEIPLLVDSIPAPAVEAGKRGAKAGAVESVASRGKERSANAEARGNPVKNAVSAGMAVDESGLEVQRPDSQPQYELDPNDHPLLPDIISTESVTEQEAGHVEAESEGPVFIDDFDMNALPMAKPVSKPKEERVKEERVKEERVQVEPEQKKQDSDDDPTGEIELAEIVSPNEKPGWKPVSPEWYGYVWGTPKSPFSFCDAIDELAQIVSLWGVVHFSKIGASTPWGLVDCQPVWNGVPEPLAKTYGSVISHYSLLRKAIKPDEFVKLWEAKALLFLGGDNATQMQRGFRDRGWLRPIKETGFEEYPLDSMVFWDLWTRQTDEVSKNNQPPWAPHVSVVALRGQDDSQAIRLLARKQLELRPIT